MGGAQVWISVVSAMAVIIIASCNQVCFIGSESNSPPGVPSRWFLPYKDPCECTAVRIGGMHIPALPYREGAPYYKGALFLSEDSNEIESYFNCSRGIITVPKVYSADVCLNPLGLEEGTITDDRLNASSQKQGWWAWNGRLNKVGAWIPPTTDETPWIKVDLVDSTVVSGVTTQGFYTHHVTKYKAACKESINAEFEYMADGNGNEVFIGNTDGDTPKTNFFGQSVVATVVRIEPTEWYEVAAMRLELLGCRLD